MRLHRTVYQDSYWNYQDPFQIETDPFEELVKARVAQFHTRRSVPRSQRDFNVSPRLAEARKALEQKRPKRKDGVAAAHSQMKKSDGQTFVSADTKPLKKQPRLIIHLPTPTAKFITIDEAS
jgi:hypothetical protein